MKHIHSPYNGKSVLQLKVNTNLTNTIIYTLFYIPWMNVRHPWVQVFSARKRSHGQIPSYQLDKSAAWPQRQKGLNLWFSPTSWKLGPQCQPVLRGLERLLAELSFRTISLHQCAHGSSIPTLVLLWYHLAVEEVKASARRGPYSFPHLYLIELEKKIAQIRIHILVKNKGYWSLCKTNKYK